MKLDLDCIRDTLLSLEENLQLGEDLRYPDFYLDDLLALPSMQAYSRPTVAYTVLKLEEGGFLYASYIEGDDGFNDILLLGISYSGHQLLEHIRPTSVWQSTQRAAKKVGSYAINFILDVASSILSSSLSS